MKQILKYHLDIDGDGQFNVETGIEFFNHMLDSFAKHGFFNLEVKAKEILELMTTIQ